VIELDFKTLAKKINGRLLNERMGSTVFRGVSIDSRTVRAAELFIAIKGENDDGHKYIEDALSRRSAGLVVSSDYGRISSIQERVPVIIVEDTHESMLQLARDYRDNIEATYLVVTGSNGKTTTKEMLYAMVHRGDDRTYCSPGNLNNLYGLPLAVFGMPGNSEYGVYELGISVPGEMRKLAEIIRPDLALITNVGPTHLETLGTIEGVAEAKFELVDALALEKPVVINADDPVIMHSASRRNRKFITYAVNNQADYLAQWKGVSEEGYSLIDIEGREVILKLFGDHQIYNILAAFATCGALDLDIRADDLNDIEFRFAPYRGEIENFSGLTLIADCYNANPVSMESGLKSFARYVKVPALAGRRNIAVIGDMLELGEKSKEYHRDIGRLLSALDIDMVYMVGPLSTDVYQAAIRNGFDKRKIWHFENVEDAGGALVKGIERGDLLYFKASRGIQLEKIITLIKGTAFRQN
jgi:UDP-N-acetylmuramoyl-tripeptide--D-alanyl-D-alanine ligase